MELRKTETLISAEKPKQYEISDESISFLSNTVIKACYIFASNYFRKSTNTVLPQEFTSLNNLMSTDAIEKDREVIQKEFMESELSKVDKLKANFIALLIFTKNLLEYKRLLLDYKIYRKQNTIDELRKKITQDQITFEAKVKQFGIENIDKDVLNHYMEQYNKYAEKTEYCIKEKEMEVFKPVNSGKSEIIKPAVSEMNNMSTQEEKQQIEHALSRPSNQKNIPAENEIIKKDAENTEDKELEQLYQDAKNKFINSLQNEENRKVKNKILKTESVYQNEQRALTTVIKRDVEKINIEEEKKTKKTLKSTLSPKEKIYNLNLLLLRKRVIPSWQINSSSSTQQFDEMRKLALLQDNYEQYTKIAKIWCNRYALQVDTTENPLHSKIIKALEELKVDTTKSLQENFKQIDVMRAFLDEELIKLKPKGINNQEDYNHLYIHSLLGQKPLKAKSKTYDFVLLNDLLKELTFLENDVNEKDKKIKSTPKK